MSLLLSAPASGCALDEPAAHALDRKLRFLSTAETRVQRAVGQALVQLVAGDHLMQLGYARLADYVRETLGISLREAQELMRIERLLPRYPETERKWMAGRISRCHVRSIVGRVKPEDDFTAACMASIMTVRHFVETMAPAAEEPEDGVLEFRASPELEVLWVACWELAMRAWGHELTQAQFLETLVMEATSEASPTLYRKLEEEGFEPPAKSWKAELAQLVAARERRLEDESGFWAQLDKAPQDVEIPDFTVPPDADAATLDARLRAAHAFSQSLTELMVVNLMKANRLSLYRTLKFDSIEQYGRERLELSATQVRRMLRIGRALKGSPTVSEAYATGVLTWSQVEQVARIARAATVEAWIEYASTTTVRKLREVVTGALKEFGPGLDLWPPPPVRASSVEAVGLLQEMLSRVPDRPTCAPGLEDSIEGHRAEDDETRLACGGPDLRPTCAPAGATQVSEDPDPFQLAKAPTTLRLRIPEDMQEFIDLGLGLCRVRLGGTPTTADCIELLLNTFLTEYMPEALAAAKEHPVPERDAWRCSVPGCGNRGPLHVHHIIFRSQGGKLIAINEITVCSAHHEHGIHAGRMAVKGHAPGDLVWVLGIQPDGTPSQVFVNERVVYSANRPVL